MQLDQLKRRELITLLGGAVAWPIAARAQQDQPVRRVAVLMPLAQSDQYAQRRVAAFQGSLSTFGWVGGKNLILETRWASNPEDIRKNAADLLASRPDVVLATGPESTAAFKAVADVPTVFVAIPDPVGAGLVATMSHPGGSVTGFTNAEYGMSGKLLEILKEIAPNLTRAAVIRDPAIPTGIGTFAAIQSVAPAMRVEVSPLSVQDPAEMEKDVAAFARSPNGGLIVTGSALAVIHRDAIVTLAARYKLPAVYWDRVLATAGGLISYGADLIEEYRQAAGYVHRILKGEKPADLPVQAPTKYELVINLKTAKALGLDMPATVLARADEVIE
jgi:putative ABC transport system substrate-binding protein